MLGFCLPATLDRSVTWSFFVPQTILLASPRSRNYEFARKYLFATGLLVAGRKELIDYAQQIRHDAIHKLTPLRPLSIVRVRLYYTAL